MTAETRQSDTGQEAETFLETALELGGKSGEEAHAIGAIDRADDQVEELFDRKYQTAASPIHRAVWDDEFPVELFRPVGAEPDAESARVMADSLDVVRRRKQAGTLLNEDVKISEETIAELSAAGYWRLLVDKEYGGCGTSFVAFARFLTRMAMIDATVSGLASVHGCIGAVDPVRTFGTPEQRAFHLPRLASGERISAFALTEPGAGSDLTALKTTAVLQGDEYSVTGDKLFITNAVCGRTVGVVCLIDERPAVLVVDLPDEENESFQLKRYGLYALKHCYNHGIHFRDFRVPRDRLLVPQRGDGLTIAYHGLNRGRIALCASAAGSMRVMLANMLPWAHYRRTYGAAIDTRELVQRRIGRLAALIVGCDALTDWCSWLLDQGFRGEMECIVAKIFGSESQKEAAVELFMKTTGGRSFLHGNLLGDNIHEYLAPCIYEGEGEILGLGFFKSLIKEHGRRFYEPIGRVMAESGLRDVNPFNPSHAWKLRKEIGHYARWRASQVFGGKQPALPSLPSPLSEHAAFAAGSLRRSRLSIDRLMQKHKLKMADRQCAMSHLSAQIQSFVVMLVASLYGGAQDDPVIRSAADVLCQDLRRSITGEQPTNAYFRTVTTLGRTIASDGFPGLEEVEADEILMPYDQ